MYLRGRFDNSQCDYCGYTSNLCECYDQEEEYCCNVCNCDTVYIPPTPTPVTLTTLGTGSNLVIGGVGPNLTIKSVSNGPGITFIEANNNIEIQSSNSVVSLSSAGTGTTLVVNGAAPGLTVKSISEGPGISFIGTSGNVEISSVSSIVTLQGTGTIGENIVAFGTGPNLKVKYVGVTGTGLSVSSDANNNILFENTSPASSVSLNSTGTGVPLVPSPNLGPTMGIKSLISGTGITMSSTNEEVTLSAVLPIFYPMALFEIAAKKYFLVDNGVGVFLELPFSSTPASDGVFAQIQSVGIPPGYTAFGIRAGEYLIHVSILFGQVRPQQFALNISYSGSSVTQQSTFGVATTNLFSNNGEYVASWYIAPKSNGLLQFSMFGGPVGAPSPFETDIEIGSSITIKRFV